MVRVCGGFTQTQAECVTVLHQSVLLDYRDSVKMQKRQRTSSSCMALFLCSILFLLVLPRCVSCSGTDKTDKTVVSKEEYYSATINATVQDSRGNTKRVISKEDGRYGQNSPKSEVKGIIITPAAVNGGECVSDCAPVMPQVGSVQAEFPE